MDLKNLESAPKRNIGIKQSLKAVRTGVAEVLFIAKDAEQYVVRSVVELAKENKVPIVYVDTMLDLGKACNIDVGAATAVIVK